MNAKSVYFASSLCLCCPITWAMEPNPLKKESSTLVNPAQLGDFNTLKELCLEGIPLSQIVARKKEYGNS